MLKSPELSADERLINEVIGEFFSEEERRDDLMLFPQLLEGNDINLQSFYADYDRETLKRVLANQMTKMLNTKDSERAQFLLDTKALFTHLDYNRNATRHIVRTYYKKVKNPETFIKFLNNFLAQNQIALHYYSGQCSDFIIKQLAGMIDGNKTFQLTLGNKVGTQIINAICEREAHEKALYINQKKYQSITKQLHEKGFVDANHLLLEEDIQVMLAELNRPGVQVTAAISTVQDYRAETLKTTLRSLKDTEGTVFIPLNVGNHWVLMIRNKTGANVNVTCWDPLHEPMKRFFFKNQTLDVVKKATKDVYKGSGQTCQVQYIYGNEQNDRFTCGYRIVRQAYKLAGIRNELTEARDSDATAICKSYIKLVAQKDPILRDQELDVIEDSRSPLVYSKAFADTNKETERGSTFQKVVACKKQISDDERIATALQEIYTKHSEIDDKTALAQAVKIASTLTSQELLQKQAKLKKTLVPLTSKFFANKKAILSSCHKEAKEEKEVTEGNALWRFISSK